jgi:peptide/nickel transport system ATP-binding protein
MQHVGIPDPTSRMRAYPHQLSGGMAQRVLIAMMLACKPRLLIADEPTTSLDVTIQAQIFELMKEIRAETGAALLLITHDLGVVSDVCERVAVMYAGQMMELASVHELFASPQHPYTNQLMSSILRVDQPIELDANYDSLAPSTRSYQIPGCRFAERCLQVHDICWQEPAPAVSLAEHHHVNCHLFSSDTNS